MNVVYLQSGGPTAVINRSLAGALRYYKEHVKEGLHIAFCDIIIKDYPTVIIFRYLVVDPWIDIIRRTRRITRWEATCFISG